MFGSINQRFSLTVLNRKIVARLTFITMLMCFSLLVHGSELEHPNSSKLVSIDTQEGTWISLDVSPDGREIVFDLLGDIYVIPAKGGKAVALTNGVQWDAQPQFSPDGQHIAFISDSVGSTNIWIMDRTGRNVSQLSNETYRRLAAPAWTPDGKYIAARKEITGKRTGGAGEIWLYSVVDGSGVRLTERQNLQKDTGEPSFSPDGRYLYFSKDVTPGDTFEYNVDPALPKYVIQRLDLTNGEVDSYISGRGGSVRATPSPNGKKIAFIRRDRSNTVLYIRDVVSGIERAVYHELDMDNQETWGMYDVYPSIAWTPDSESIIFWAGGKIQSLNTHSNELVDIPFHVKGQREVFETLKFPVEVAPSEFAVKAIRWASKSPDGKHVVFQALGHLYIRALPHGTVRRLTDQDDHFEFYPSWSRDGQSIVYTTWDDKLLGSVRIYSLKSEQEVILNEKPGHYVEPAFSPNGSVVIYRRVGGGVLRDPSWSEDQGIYKVSSAGGSSTLITKSGIQPHFGRSNDRIYFLHVESGDPNDARFLRSISLNGSREIDHFASKRATEIRISPDEEWVAFREQFRIFTAPFIRAGTAVELEPTTRSIPVREVAPSGKYIHWSNEGGLLNWSVGPSLFSHKMDSKPVDAVATDASFSSSKSEIDLGFKAATDVPTGAVVLRGARIITMRGDEVLERGTIVINGNRITEVSQGNDAELPENAFIIDARGLTVMPGIIDAHAHGPQATNLITPQQNWQQYANLAFGVTTIHDPANRNDSIFPVAEMQRAGLLVSPRVYSTGHTLYESSGIDSVQIDNLDDAREHVKRLKADGAISVKSYNLPRRQQRQQVIRAARESGMMVNLEGGIRYHYDLSSIVDGVTTLEHVLPVAQIYEDVLQLWAGTDSAYTPTLIVNVKGVFGENYWYQHTDVWKDEHLLNFVPRDWLDLRSRRRQMVPDEDYSHVKMAEGAKLLLDAGVRVQLGAHGQLPGLGAHWELWNLVQGGMSELEGIRAATFDGARSEGLDKDIGSIEQGKLADLIVLTENPLDNIRNSTSIRYVIQNGRVYDALTMDEIGNHTRKRDPFYWEFN